MLSRANSYWCGCAGTGRFSISQSYSGRWSSNSSVHSEWVTPSIASDWPWAIVVGRIDAPGVAGARVLGVQDAVQDRIAQVHVGRRHVDLRPQHACAVGELAGAHAAEQVEVLLDRAIAVGRVLPRFGQRAALAAHPIGRRIIDIGLALADQVFGPFVELLEIVRRVIEMLAPVEAQPVHVALDRVDELLLLLGRIGVVEAQVAPAAEIPPPRRSSGRSTWRGRYADSRSVPAESGSPLRSRGRLPGHPG